MKSILMMSLALVLALSLPMMAQEKEMGKAEQADTMKPPPPLEDDWANWLVGEWQGTSKSMMGEAKETQSYEIGLGGQFLMLHVISEMGPQKFEGRGALTRNMEGELVGFWIDSFRSMSQGKGTRDGNKQTFLWTTPGQPGSYTRTMEKVDNDH